MNWLSNLFWDDRDRVVFLIDGLRSEEKHLAHLFRDERMTTALNSLTSTLDEIRTRERRLNAKDHRRIRKFIGESFSISYTQKVELFQSLLQKGFKTVLCNGEADHYVSQMVDVTVLACDSDFFCHGNVTTVLEPFIQRNQLYVRSTAKVDILKQLHIREPILRALGIISGNDYSPNKRNYGVSRNLDILKYVG